MHEPNFETHPVTNPPLASDSLEQWMGAVASPSATPAGGAAAAVSAALGAALVEMVAGMTRSRERYAAVHEQASTARFRAAELRAELLGLASRDAEVFAEFVRALALPKASDAERVTRERAKAWALRQGAEVQLTVLRRTAEAADLAAAVAGWGLATAIGDAATGVFLAAGAARSAYWAVRANLDAAGEASPEASGWLQDGLELLERTEAAEWRVRQLLSERIH
jgi:formiminotetrahydrofolate cyclodeaminase